MKEITQKYIKSLFTYRDGNLYWRVSLNRSIKIGSKAGSLKRIGYYKIGINGKTYLNHRLIYLYHYGFIPKQIDHIDNNKLNNKIENLREITNSQNHMNQKSHKNSASKYKGVSWYKRINKWRVQIQINNKNKHLGYFDDEINAAKVYNKKAIELFGKYACLNEI